MTLDEDVAARLKTEVRRTGKPFRAVVNECLRVALFKKRAGPAREPRFKIKTRDLGQLRLGLSLDNIGDLLEIAEGPLHR